MPTDGSFLQWMGAQFPQDAYSAFRPRTGSTGFQNYFQGSYGNIWDDYMAKIGAMTREGKDPNLTFTDFLGGYDWSSAWNQLTPWERGARLPGAARWNVGVS